MSVTFGIEANPTGAFKAECYNDGNPVVVARANSYEGILGGIAAHKVSCDECSAYGLYAEAVMDVSDEFDVNLANTNARMMLGILGLDEGDELVGMVDAEQFLGAILLAMASDRDDSGVLATEVAPGSRGARMVDCGLPAGYYAERFGALHALASEAARLGRPVVWS